MSNLHPHNPEPWEVKNKTEIVDANGVQIDDVSGKTTSFSEDAANARRIVECVNAFVGYHDPETLMRWIKLIKTDPHGPVDVSQLLHKMETQQKCIEELQEALRVCSKSLATYGEHPIIEKHVKSVLKK